MHQGLTTRILICVSILLATRAYAQLNRSNEIIETIEDIQLQDDSANKKPENPNKPKFDEEFGDKKTVPSEDTKAIEEEIAEPETPTNREEQKANTEEKESYEDALEKNAKKNRFEKREISPEDLKNFEVNPVQPEPAPEPPVVEAPKKPTPINPEPEDEINEEISKMPVETKPKEESEEQKNVEYPPEEPGVPIQYAPEPTGPVISYKNEKRLSDDQIKNLSEKTKVEIEKDPFVEGTLSKKIGEYLKPYRERRPSWTHEFEIGASQYEPVNYTSNIITTNGTTTDDFESFYQYGDVPSPSIGFEFKRNFSFGAISLGASGSYYTSTQGEASISLITPAIKASLYLDTLFDEPYIVPYGTVGYAYTMYSESDSLTGLDLSGASDNFFVGLGLLLQLDWLDPVSDSQSYAELGIENTFIFIEARTYLDKGIMGIKDDPDVYADFSSLTYIAGGIKLEF